MLPILCFLLECLSTQDPYTIFLGSISHVEHVEFYPLKIHGIVETYSVDMCFAHSPHRACEHLGHSITEWSQRTEDSRHTQFN